MDTGIEYKNGKNYLYLEVPAVSVLGGEDEPTGKIVKRNQHVFIHCGCNINVKGENIAEVEPNPALAEWGQIQPGYKVHPNTDKVQVGFWFTARKDTDLSKLKYGARLYLLA